MGQLEHLSNAQLLHLLHQATEMEKFRLAKENYALFLELILKNSPRPYIHSAHTLLLCKKLKEIVDGKCKRLIVCMPCRHSKSQTISRHFTAWYFANNPEHDIIIASYGADLAQSDFSMPARDIIENYGQQIFGVKLDPRKRSLDHWKLDGHSGSFYATGIGSATTGRGFHLCVIDDPIKDFKEANSPAVKAGIYDWYKTVLRSRAVPQKEGGAIILVTTRWAEDDLAGCLLRDAKEEGEQWDTLILKAICDSKDDPLGREIGTALWPERYPLEELMSLKGTMGTMKFEALYQQNPHPLEGILFNESWLRYYCDDDVKFNPPDNTYYFKESDPVITRYMAVDPSVGTKSGNDWTVIIVADVTRQKQILVRKIFRKQINIPDQIKLIISVNEIFHPNKIFIEEVGFSSCSREISLDQGHFLPFCPIKRGGRSAASKEVRISEMGPFFEAGKIWVQKDMITFTDEYKNYPSGPWDDQLDCLQQITDAVKLLPSFGNIGLSTSQAYQKEMESFIAVPPSKFSFHHFNFLDSLNISSTSSPYQF
jgi:phage terminase large subunit-like protein